MASTSAVFMAAPVAQTRHLPPSPASAFLKPLPLRPSKPSPMPAVAKFQVRASLKEKVVTGLTAAALTASVIAPDAAEAAVSPSLKNFLLSIGYGGVVAVAIVGAIVAVSNFDPVKRG
ncbi:hypothetical protein SASPL_129308 [Salvia splendens]|uniref:Photosystem II PsbX n=1 Tax=Salvia splendens TaxID=180675 RepID=A0A8X8XFI1_SALSN|nr:uncharacterized protein LOC121750526 [Salvia splendens]KAG6411230.1 hypothetical protein SASPL_129308 [Salvia splendens]